MDSVHLHDRVMYACLILLNLLMVMPAISNLSTPHSLNESFNQFRLSVALYRTFALYYKLNSPKGCAYFATSPNLLPTVGL